MASSKNLGLVLALGLFLVLFAGVALFGFGFAVQAPVVETPPETTDLQSEVKLSGQSVCLPHKNPGEIQTMECAYGLQVGEDFYALDLGSFMTDFETGETVSLEGTFVPVEALSSDHWQTYDIVGVVTVMAIIK